MKAAGRQAGGRPDDDDDDAGCWCGVNAGACGGELACSTCHIFFDKVGGEGERLAGGWWSLCGWWWWCGCRPQSVYDALPAKKEEEEDMLDLAWGLTDT